MPFKITAGLIACLSAYTCHLSIARAWAWGGNFTQWGLVWTIMALGYALGYWKRTPVKLLSLSPLILLPPYNVQPALGLAQIFILMMTMSLLMRQLSEAHFIKVSYAGIVGFVAAYLWILPADLAGLLGFGIGLLFLTSRKKLGILFLLLSLLMLGLTTPQPSWLHKHWTPEGWVVVWEQEGSRYLGFLRGSKLAPHTRMLVAYPHHPQDYILASTTLFTSAPSPEAVLDLGTGGAGFTKWVHAGYPSAHFTTVDISSRIQHLAREWFEAPQEINYVTSDARHYLTTTEQTFDWVYVDLYRFNVPPSHVLTQEFFALLAQRTTSSSTLVLNVLPAETWWEPLATTISTIFPSRKLTLYTHPSGQGIVLIQANAVDYPTPAGYTRAVWPQPTKPLTDTHNVTLVR
jgi:hypothetical protein